MLTNSSGGATCAKCIANCSNCSNSTSCNTCFNDYDWTWEEAFDKFGFNDGDGQVMTDDVVRPGWLSARSTALSQVSAMLARRSSLGTPSADNVFQSGGRSGARVASASARPS